MGGDGGVIATKRRFFVKVKQAAEKKDLAEVAAAQWHTCALTNQVLKEPIVACELGKLYNKQAVLSFLLSKRPMPKGMKHIKGLKSLIACHFTRNPMYDESSADSATYMKASSIPGAFVCPVSGLETNGKHQFMLLKGCGHLLSEAAMKEIPGSKCLSCDKEFTPLDVIILCPADSTSAVKNRDAMLKRKKLKKAAKADKAKPASNDSKVEEGAGAGAGAGSGAGVQDGAAAAPAEHKLKKKKRAKRAAPDVPGGAAAAAGEPGDEQAAAKRKPTTLQGKVAAKAAAALAARKASSDVYSRMFHKAGPEDTSDASNQNLFIRTATNVYGVSRTYN